ncbi:MAG: sugar kinase [Pseudomonadota bacterium]
MTRIVIIGEAMLELSDLDGDNVHLAYGGDTLNTAIYLARLGCAPHYVTALGQDGFSDRMRLEWEKEGVRTDHILRHPTRLPGLYAIETDDQGERRFHYWRSESAARAFFDLPDHKHALAFAAKADWLFVSGITLSIFDQAERDALIQTARAVRARGGHVVFDPNYRPKGWASPKAAWSAMKPFAEETSLALPTHDDEDTLHGSATCSAHAERWKALGVSNIILKRGSSGAMIFASDQDPVHVPADSVLVPKDTTGAGDSFNAALIASLVSGRSLEEAVKTANRLAAYVIQHAGAIAPQAGMPSL